MGLFDKFVDSIPLIGDIIGGSMASSAQAYANRTNIKNAREQREWEANMANTAVQRRRADIEKAGFNPVLAATGAGAATPSVSTPTVEPTVRPGQYNLGNALMQREQLQNMRAGTAKLAAEAREAVVRAKSMETWGEFEAETKAKMNAALLDIQKGIAKNEIKMSDLERQRLEETLPHLISLAASQAETGRLNLSALKASAKMSDTTFGQVLPYLQAILGIGNQGLNLYHGIRGGSDITETVENESRAGGRLHREKTIIRRK